MVESQPSKLLVAGSIPVSRSILRPALGALVAARAVQGVGAVLGQVQAVQVAQRGEVLQREADRVGRALPERTRGRTTQ